jgi:hypothetical protein
MSVEWSGLAELKKGLHDLPADLTREAKTIVDRTAQTTLNQTALAYTGGAAGLRSSLKIHSSEHYGLAFSEVRNTAKEAHLWEFGTQNRRTYAGWNRGRVIPAADRGQQGLVPIAIRNRRRMYDELMAMLTRAGLTVTGNVG